MRRSNLGHMAPTQICDAGELVGDSKSRLNDDILRALIDAKGITIAELARRSGVSRATIFRLIAGRNGGRAGTARDLARTLDTTVETLYAPKRIAS